MKTIIRSVNEHKITFICGSNQDENHFLIQNSMENDLWFHANDEPSPHVIGKIHDLNLTGKQHRKLIVQGIEVLKMQMKHSGQLKVVISLIKDIICLDKPGLVTFEAGTCQKIILK